MAKSGNMSLETITPIVAKALIEASKDRNFRSARTADIDRYAKDISEGRWEINGDTIKIDSSGVVWDGQHRLLGCIQANAPFKTWVLRDVEPTITDVGKNRTTAQYLSARNEDNQTVLAGILSLVVKHKNGALDNLESLSRIRKAVSVPERLAALEDCPELRKYAEKISRARTQKPPLGFLWWLFGKDFPRKTDEFFEQFISNENISRANPAWHLRRKLIDNKPKGSRFEQESVLGWGVAALQAHVTNQKINRLEKCSKVAIKKEK